MQTWTTCKHLIIPIINLCLIIFACVIIWLIISTLWDNTWHIDYISIYCKQKSMNLFLLLLIIISTLRLIPCLVIFERMNIRWHFQIFWTSVKSNLGKFITLFPFMYFVRLSKQIEMVARMKKLCGLSHCRHKRDNFEYIN